MNRTPLTATIAPLLIGSMLIQPAAMWAQNLAGESVDAAANRELARRGAREERARSEMTLGNEALRKKDYDEAFDHFKNACYDITPGAPATAQSRKAAEDGIKLAGIKLAEQRVTEGYYVKAVQVLQEVLRQNPSDRASGPYSVHATARLLKNIEAPDYFNKQMTPQHRTKVEDVKQLFIEAKGYTDLGRYDLADRKYQEIITRDPYNQAARDGRQEVANMKMRSSRAGYNATRAIALWEVEKEWDRPAKRFDRKIKDVITSGPSTAPNTVAITAKLNNIVFQKIDFNETSVREAIEFLVDKSKKLDEKGEGVNIVLKLGDEGGGGAAHAAPAPAPAPGIPGLGEPAPGGVPGIPALPGGGGGGGVNKVSFRLNNVPLIEVIKVITNMANLKYKIEPFAVSIVPLGTQTEELFNREWKVAPNMITQAPGVGGGGAAPAPGGGLGAPPADPGAGVQSSARDWLIANGIAFPPGSVAMYSKASSTLIVRNTQDNLDLIQKIIEIGQTEGGAKQIEIQAKFVEISQSNLKELSFDWMLGQSNIPRNLNVFTGGGTAGTGNALNPQNFAFPQNIGDAPVTAGNRSGSTAINGSIIDALLAGTGAGGLLAPGIASLIGAGTDPTFQLIMRGLNQKKGVDLLSAPRVTTKSAQIAKIEIIREFKYPTEFSPPQIPQTFGGVAGGGLGGGGGGFGGGGGGGNFPVTPTTPTAFDKRDVGVTLEVEPTILPDGYSIDMHLSPQVVEFEGFINYGSPIQTTSTNPFTGITTTNVLTPNVINQPIFSTRKITTNVTVFDGATIVLGGLIREDVQKVEDKTPILGDIPLIGRLFRSNADQHTKRNLVIFVTARLVNPEGAPITSDEEKEESVDALPLPEIAPPLLPNMGGGKTYRPVAMPRNYRASQTSAPSGGVLNPAARR